METEAVGRVVTEARVENLKDLWAVEQGLRPEDQARSITSSQSSRLIRIVSVTLACS